ncbi:MAG: hypothetical protein J6S67_17330 [Methanobrevibacter sp.]|nr:hypothetical protein [Methanobrevibacter sp.]
MFGWLFNGPEGERVFDTDELDFFDSDNIDWQSFRAEAAKDILCAMISTVHEFNPNEIDIALDITDNLISKLKEKEEK